MRMYPDIGLFIKAMARCQQTCCNLTVFGGVAVLFNELSFILMLRREQEDREKKRIAQLIKDKMDQEKKLHAQRLQKEEKERYEI